MPKFFANLIPFFLFFYALSNWLFVRRVQREYSSAYSGTEYELEESDYNLIPLSMFIIVFIYIFFPIRTCINKCQADDSALYDTTGYDSVFLEFMTDYDRENPVTKKAGTLRMIEERMKSASGGELNEEDKQ